MEEGEYTTPLRSTTEELSTKPRVRINAKQTSKGEWYFDVTAETDDVQYSVNLLDEAIHKTQEVFTREGRTLAKP